jgi:hypothetical protein|tara:strand:+ start:1139 stop:1525 length:387 start_codon:yes stop_codon:yes gene_type:complete
MKKLLSLISGGLIKDVGSVIDSLTTTDEERLEAKQKLQELLEKADQDAQGQITERWKLDMQSDSFLSKNIRPLVLIYLTVIFTVLSFFDGNIGGFQVDEAYIPIFQSLLITVYGAYFVGRTWEKSKKQ